MTKHSYLDDIHDDINKRHQFILQIAEKIATFAERNNKYTWREVAQNMIDNNESTAEVNIACPHCGQKLVYLVFKHPGFPPRYSEMYVCANCQKQYNEHLAQLTTEKAHNNSGITLGEINPILERLINKLSEAGLSFSYHAEGGNFGFLYFNYKNSIFYIWIEEGSTIRFFYPNWACLSSDALTQNISSQIQNYNLNNQPAIYWLKEEPMLTLSSTVSLDCETEDAINYNNISHLLDLLLDSPKEILGLVNGNQELKPYSKDRNEGFTDNRMALIIESSLTDLSDCSNIEVDEDNDVFFSYKGKNMYAHILDKNSVKIVYYCTQLNDTTPETPHQTRICDDPLTIAIQWANMICPIKTTFYKPDINQHAISVNINIDIDHFKNHDIATINDTLNILSTYFDSVLAEIIFCSEDGIELINTWYQPSIYNCDPNN